MGFMHLRYGFCGLKFSIFEVGTDKEVLLADLGNDFERGTRAV